MKLHKSFFDRENVISIANDLIGKVILTDIDNKLTTARIIETEAYSYKEKACHAHNNRYTNRTKVMFEAGGTSYVYLCYGIHKLFNIVTNSKGIAEAVLIRAVEPLHGIDTMLKRRKFDKISPQLTSGPGKLSQALGIDLKHNNINLTENSIWLEDDGYKMDIKKISSSPRIGVGYAEEDALLPWRFFLSENQFVSKGRIDY